MSVLLIPLLRNLLMKTADQWRSVYLIPAIVGVVVSLISLLCARETDTFIDTRIRYLSMSDEELQAEEARKKAQDSQGGIIDALKFGFSHKQLRWVFICFALAGIGVVGSMNYQAIITHGYAESVYHLHTEEILEKISISHVNTALILAPIGLALSQVVMGFVSDEQANVTATGIPKTTEPPTTAATVIICPSSKPTA